MMLRRHPCSRAGVLLAHLVRGAFPALLDRREQVRVGGHHVGRAKRVQNADALQRATDALADSEAPPQRDCRA
jgi:hypothetical protein